MLSIVIPAYNEEKNIQILLDELIAILNKSGINSYEVIIIDDHSEDQTLNKVRDLHNKNIRIIRLSRRSGSHMASRAGFLLSRGDMVLCLAADGQDDPSVIPQMITKMKKGADIVWAGREERNESFFSKLSTAIFYKLLRCLTEYGQIDSNISNIDFYLLNRKVVDAINKFKEKNTSLLGLIIWLGFKQDYCKYKRRKRNKGQSKWTFRSRFRFAEDWIIAFSGLPLKLMSIFGILIASCGFFYAIFIFFYAILGFSKPGWAESVIIILISSGIQMIMLGVLGEYLWRTLEETRKRPLFFVEDGDINNLE